MCAKWVPKLWMLSEKVRIFEKTKWVKSEWAKSEGAKSEGVKSEGAKSEGSKSEFPQITVSSMELFFQQLVQRRETSNTSCLLFMFQTGNTNANKLMHCPTEPIGCLCVIFTNKNAIEDTVENYFLCIFPNYSQWQFEQLFWPRLTSLCPIVLKLCCLCPTCESHWMVGSGLKIHQRWMCLSIQIPNVGFDRGACWDLRSM